MGTRTPSLHGRCTRVHWRRQHSLWYSPRIWIWFYDFSFKSSCTHTIAWTFSTKWRRRAKRSSDQLTSWLIRPHVKETGASTWRKHCHVFTWPYAIHFIPTNMVRTRVRGNLCMRKQNTKTTVPLDVTPERRTKRCSPRFRPGGRFCELRFRYLSSPTGREGEISRPLDHMRQIPFIHSARLLDSTNFYIYRTVF